MPSSLCLSVCPAFHPTRQHVSRETTDRRDAWARASPDPHRDHSTSPLSTQSKPVASSKIPPTHSSLAFAFALRSSPAVASDVVPPPHRRIYPINKYIATPPSRRRPKVPCPIPSSIVPSPAGQSRSINCRRTRPVVLISIFAASHRLAERAVVSSHHSELAASFITSPVLTACAAIGALQRDRTL